MESQSRIEILKFYLRYLLPYNIILILILVLLTWLWPSILPFGPFAFWTFHGSFLDIMNDAWPIFAWGAAWLLLLFFLGHRFLMALGQGLAIAGETRTDENNDGAAASTNDQQGDWSGFARDIAAIFLSSVAPVNGVVQSLWYSVAGGIKYRWLSFYFTMLWLTLANFLLGGFASNGILSWLYLSIVGPLVNFLTFGKLYAILFHPTWGWVVGSAVVILSFRNFQRQVMSCNISVSWFFSWPVGLFLFLIMFKYGLFASIMIHCTYEAFLIVLTAFLARR